MGSNDLQVVLDQLGVAAGQWRGLSTHLAAAVPPAAGRPFQPTTAAVSGINAAIGGNAAVFVGRIEATTAGVTSAAAGYANQEATNAVAMAAVTQVRVA